jgi:3-oxoacyl-[acyl-carrier-protein] synthase-1
MAGVLGVALHCARGADLAQAVAAIARGECTATSRIEVPVVDTLEILPYYGAGGLGLDEACAVLEAARADAGLDRAAWSRSALIVGSTSLTLPHHEGEGALPRYPEGGVRHQARALMARSGIAGPDFTIQSACTSSAHGVALAHRLIASGHVAHAVILGWEQEHRFSTAGFAAMNVLSRTKMRPFGADRDGLILGEAVGAVVLGPTREGAPQLAGSANRIDPQGESSADASGAAFAATLRAALAQAAIAPGQVSLIKAHAAGSLPNDAAESRALQSAFMAMPPVMSLKPYLGHTAGASGCAELALLIGAWRSGFVPATPGCAEPDPALGIVPSSIAQPWKGGIAVLDFLGFGGGQAALVVRDAH